MPPRHPIGSAFRGRRPGGPGPVEPSAETKGRGETRDADVPMPLKDYAGSERFSVTALAREALGNLIRRRPGAA